MTSLLGKILNRTPVPFTGRVAPFAMPTARSGGMTAQMNAVSEVSTLFAITDRIGKAVSQIDWKLYRPSVDRRRVMAPDEKPKRTEITSHAALDLWNTPNGFYDQRMFIEAAEQHMDTAGESTIVLVKDDTFGIPLEMWVVRPDRMEPVRHPTEFLTGWWYTGPQGEKIPLRKDEVIQVPYAPNPLDPYRGMSPVTAALIDAESSYAAAEWNRNFFRNSAEPGGVLETDEELSDPDFDRIVKRWRESHQGVHNAHRVALLEMGLKWKPAAYSPKDMQFVELRGVSREILREAFGIHPHMLGITEDVNKANAEAAEITFSRWTITPRAEIWKSALNTKLLPMFDAVGQVEFDHAGVVPEDREADDRERTSRANAAAALAGANVWDPDDICQVVGLPVMGKLPTPAPQPAAAPAPNGQIVPAG